MLSNDHFLVSVKLKEIIVSCLTFMYSETLKESYKSLELPIKPSESSTDEEGSRDYDNEAEISEYLTLAQLGSILRELAVKGKNYNNNRLPRMLSSDIGYSAIFDNRY